jgi:hypothetical protein
MIRFKPRTLSRSLVLFFEMIADTLRTRARLTKSQVICIFQQKDKSHSANMLANCYGVSEKAIRDIWKGRTWFRETSQVDAARSLQVKNESQRSGFTDKDRGKKRTISRASLLKQQKCDSSKGTGEAQTKPCIQPDTSVWPTFRNQRDSIDDLLYEWNYEMWVDADSQAADPFLHDWRPTSSDLF